MAALALACTVLLAPAHAEKADRLKEMNIVSDRGGKLDQQNRFAEVEGNVVITSHRLILKTGDGRTASVRFGGDVPFFVYNEGLRLTKTMGSTLLKFKTMSDDTAEIVGELLAKVTRPEL